ncbi:MAG: S1C family serine protease [Thermomicrobiales bacterium]
MEAPSESSSGTLAAVLKRTGIGAALIFGLAGGAVGATIISGANAQDATSTPNADSSTTTTQDAASNVVADVAAEVNPAVVTVINLQKQVNPFNGTTSDSDTPVSSGSGFIIDEDGHVVTNWHVVDGGDEFQVKYADGTTVNATLVGSDQFQDVAVLQLDLSGGQKVPGVAKLGDSSTMRAGDTVIAIGSPYGELTNSVTSGQINAVDRELDTGDGYELSNLFQHDAAIYPGNSGGPLINSAGEIIGINVAKASYTTGMDSTDSIGFAIEIDAVKDLVNQIIQNGSVARPYIGISVQPVASRDGQTLAGEQVMDVTADTPAADAGLQVGDVITAVDGTTIDQDHQFMNLAVLTHNPGDTIKLTVDRNGQSQEISITLGTRPAGLAASEPAQDSTAPNSANPDATAESGQ